MLIKHGKCKTLGALKQVCGMKMNKIKCKLSVFFFLKQKHN